MIDIGCLFSEAQNDVDDGCLLSEAQNDVDDGCLLSEAQKDVDDGCLLSEAQKDVDDGCLLSEAQKVCKDVIRDDCFWRFHYMSLNVCLLPWNRYWKISKTLLHSTEVSYVTYYLPHK